VNIDKSAHGRSKEKINENIDVQRCSLALHAA